MLVDQRDAEMLTGGEPANRAADTVESAMASVDGIPTVFGRLVYLASMWDSPAAGCRSDPRAEINCCDSVRIAVGRAHLDTFLYWLSLSLERQRHDLMRFADSDGPGAYECIRSWWISGFFDDLAPAAAGGHEASLFRNDLRIVIESLIGDTEE